MHSLSFARREYLIAARTLVELDRIHQDRGRAAELALYATRARLRPDHNAELLISAAQFNQDVGNLKTCARLCVNLQLRFYGMVNYSYTLSNWNESRSFALHLQPLADYECTISKFSSACPVLFAS